MTPPRYQYDTDGPASDLPQIVAHLAAYKDGASNFDEMVKARPHAKALSISIHGAEADCYDMENGALTIPSGVQCAKRDLDAGKEWPWLYFSTSNYDAVEAYCRKAGIWGKVHFWGAHYGLTDAEAEALINSGQGYVAVQNVAAGYGATGHWDRSVLAAHIAGYDPAPKPPKPVKAGTPFAPDMAKAVELAQGRYLARANHKDGMDAKARKATHELIAAATKALSVKP